MKPKSVLLAVSLFVLPLFGAPIEKQVQPEESQRYRVLDGFWVDANHGIDPSVIDGYRVAYGDASHHILILEKCTGKHQYRFVQKPQKELGVAAAEGFFAVPSTFSSDLGKNTAVVMEKAVDAGGTRDYLLLDTVRTKTLQKELNYGAGKGYEFLAISSYGLNYVLMEKPSPEAPPVPDRYLLLATSRTSSMQSELNQAVAKGYKVVAGSGGDELKIILEKSSSSPEYRLLATGRSSTLEKEINQAAAMGFRPLPKTLLAINRQNNMFASLSFSALETVIIVERVAQPELFTYKIIGTNRVGTFKNELAQAAGEGFELIEFTLTYTEQVGLLRRGVLAHSTEEQTKPELNKTTE